MTTHRPHHLLRRSACTVAAAAIGLLGALALSQAALAQVVPPVGPGVRAAREPKTGEEAVAVEAAVVGEVRPGGEVRVAVTFDVIPGWHVYWSNPGESGSATSIELELPEGCVVERPEGRAIDFPVPQVFRKGETTFGYEGTVTLSIPVRLPAEVPAAGLPVKVRSRWLVCKERCLMGSNEAAVDLARAVAKDSRAAERLAASLRSLPAPLPPGWRVSIEEVTPESAVLVVDAAGAAGPLIFVPDDTPGVLLASGYLAEAKDGALRAELTVRPENALGRPLEVAGILLVGKDGAAHAFRLPVPAAKP